MKVSIIVPVYNTEKYLKTCLDSLVNQTLLEKEIIIIDDQSSDNSKKIIADYKEKYTCIKAYYNEKNLGQSKTRNIGLEKASGEYIAFLDSDDYVTLNMYEEMYNAAKKYDADVVTTNLNFVKDDYYAKNSLDFLGKRPGCLVIPSEDKDFIYSQSPSLCNKLFKKELIGNYRFLDDCMWEDVAFSYTRLLEANRIYNTNNVGYFYRRDVTGNSVSAHGYRPNPHLSDALIVASELETEMKKVGKYEEFSQQIRLLQFAVCLERINEINEWKISEEEKNAVKDELYDSIYNRFGTLDGIDQINLQTKCGFLVTEEYNKRYSEEKNKHK